MPLQSSSERDIDTIVEGDNSQAPLPRGLLYNHSYVSCLTRTPLYDLYRVLAPSGKLRLLQLVRAGLPSRDVETLERLMRPQHAVLPPFDCHPGEPGELVLITDPHEQTLADRFQECWAQGLPGIPQLELLDYLRTLAHALDELYVQHGLMHLWLHPRHILLTGGKPQLSCYGLAQLFWWPMRQSISQLNPRYSAPELFEDQITRRCDQYSLAIIYAEMRTGVHPLGGSRVRRQHRQHEPNLDLLSVAEKKVLQQALAYATHDRFTSCTELVQSLSRAIAAAEPDAPRTLPSLIHSPSQPAPLPTLTTSTEDLHQFLAELRQLTGDDTLTAPGFNFRYELAPGPSIHHHFTIRAPLSQLLTRLDLFRKQWHGELTMRGQDQLVLGLVPPTTFWRRWLGRRIVLQLRLVVPAPSDGQRTDINIEMQMQGTEKEQALQILQQYGLEVLQGLRQTLHVMPELRSQQRLPCSQPLMVLPVEDGQVSEPISCVGKDISPSGVGFFTQYPVGDTNIYVSLPWLPRHGGYAVHAQVVRGQNAAHGWYELGAAFCVKG